MTADGTVAADADALKAVEEAARAACGTVADLATVPGERLDDALRAIAGRLGRQSGRFRAGPAHHRERPHALTPLIGARVDETCRSAATSPHSTACGRPHRDGGLAARLR